MNMSFSPQVMLTLQRALKLHESGALKDARGLYEQVLRQQPKNFDALHLLGVVHHQQGDHKEATRLIRQAIKLYAQNPLFHVNLANALTEIGDYTEALQHYDRALKLAPGHADIELNRAAALTDLGLVDEANLVFQRHLQHNPRNQSAWYNLALLARRKHQPDVAIEAFQRVLQLDGRNTQAMYELARTHYTEEQINESLVTLDILLGIEPEHEKAWALRGMALFRYGRPDLALESLLQSKQGNHHVLSELLMVSLGTLQWERYETLKADLTTSVRLGKTVEMPFHVLPIQTDAKQQLETLQQWVKVNQPAHPHAPIFQHRHEKIRVAYVSGDFKNHPVSFLTAELFELHDKNRFDIIGVNINSKDEHDAMTERISKACGQFLVARGTSDADLLRQLHALEIDIAIDLAGLTDHNRISLFAHRIAPVQVNYLGFPATLGAPYIDYIIGDETVIPPELAPCYAEQVVYMPDTFQPNDRQRPIADTPTTRTEVGLPDDVTVFCCFCNNYKYNPDTFDAWAGILQAVPDSVLWLLANSAFIEERIKLEMSKRQIKPERLVFGGRLPQDQYLARYRLADLFLDTHPFNGGTTVSDALWAGLPVLTLSGETFASRMAGSLLKAMGLSNFITTTQAQYQQLAVEWGRDRHKLVKLKHQLMAEGHGRVLFNTPLYVQHLESAYEEMIRRHHRGEKPSPMWVNGLQKLGTAV